MFTSVPDAVLGYHLNPLTCGVAKFNQRLARELNVPSGSVYDIHDYQCPLVSLKFSEVGSLPWPGNGISIRQAYDLFLHDRYADGTWLKFANRVYVGNAEIAQAVSRQRPDVIEAFCPATVDGCPSRGAYQVLVFGMANKVALPRFRALKDELDREHRHYTVNLSTAVHEGSPWDEGLTQAVTGMREIFGDKLRVLGFLGDDALAKELNACDAVAAYFDPALRANNTSAWAALAAGKKLYTNTDEFSPPLDVEAHSWDKLVELIRGA